MKSMVDKAEMKDQNGFQAAMMPLAISSILTYLRDYLLDNT